MILKSIAKNTNPQMLNKSAGISVALTLSNHCANVKLSAPKLVIVKSKMVKANAAVNIMKRMKEDLTILLLTGPSI